MRDEELLVVIKAKAKACVHADDACDLVYFINNAVGADAPWRNWHCDLHHYAGSGAKPRCPECMARQNPPK